MRLAGMPTPGESGRKTNLGKRYLTFDRTTQSLESLHEGFAPLVLDAHTLKDLEIFETDGDAKSLYAFCNFTRTEGGAKLLRKRMERPWCEGERIRITQQSIAFICENRDIFTTLPAYIVQSVESYQREVLLSVTDTNPVAFVLQGFNVYFNHDRHYRSMVRGVQYTCSVIRSLRLFMAHKELELAVGELVPLLVELQELLSSPWIREVPEEQVAGSSPFKVFRLDQLFRQHNKSVILRILQIVYEMDALVSMADATINHGFTLPVVLEGELRIEASELIHPYLKKPVANAVELNQQQRLLFLTGPNMAGKTTYLRAVAIALYLGHLGMGVPAKSFGFVPVERLYSSISLNDDLHAGISYFRAEALRIKAVAESIAEGRSVVAVMDEPFKGTNVKDAYDASLAVLNRFANKEGCLFLFSSHLIELDEQLEEAHFITRSHFVADVEGGKLSFDYLLRPGVSDQRLGVRVLEEEGVFALLDGMQRIGAESSGS
jgi:DNA mismatch repair protein MutS